MSRKRPHGDIVSISSPTDQEIDQAAESLSNDIQEVLNCHLAYADQHADTWHELFENTRLDPNPTPARIFAERILTNDGIKRVIKGLLRRSLRRARSEGINMSNEMASAAFDFTK